MMEIHIQRTTAYSNVIEHLEVVGIFIFINLFKLASCNLSFLQYS